MYPSSEFSVNKLLVMWSSQIMMNLFFYSGPAKKLTFADQVITKLVETLSCYDYYVLNGHLINASLQISTKSYGGT